MGSDVDGIASLRLPPPYAETDHNAHIDSTHAPKLTDEVTTISIEFGAGFARAAYSSPKVANGEVQNVLWYPQLAGEAIQEIPTCLLYDKTGNLVAWGADAQCSLRTPGSYFIDGLLYGPLGTRLSPDALPPMKHEFDVVTQYLLCLWSDLHKQITDSQLGAYASSVDSVEVVVRVPSYWGPTERQLLHTAFITASFIHSPTLTSRIPISIFTGHETTLAYCSSTIADTLKLSDTVLVCDAGDSTIDVVGYRVTGDITRAETSQISTMSSWINTGAIYLDLRFRELMKTLLLDHPAHCDPASLAYLTHSFSQTDRRTFKGEEEDCDWFHYTCFNVEDPHAPEIGLNNGQMDIPGILLRREVFDPVVAQIVFAIEQYMDSLTTEFDTLLLIGSLAESEYVRTKVEEYFLPRVLFVERPSDADNINLVGAASHWTTFATREPLYDKGMILPGYSQRDTAPTTDFDHKRAIWDAFYAIPRTELTVYHPMREDDTHSTDEDSLEGNPQLNIALDSAEEPEAGRGDANVQIAEPVPTVLHQGTLVPGQTACTAPPINASGDAADVQPTTCLPETSQNSTGSSDPPHPVNRAKARKSKRSRKRNNKTDNQASELRQTLESIISNGILNGADINMGCEEDYQEAQLLLERIKLGGRRVARSGRSEWLYESRASPAIQRTRRQGITVVVNTQRNCGNTTHVKHENSHNDASRAEHNTGNTHNTNSGSGTFNIDTYDTYDMAQTEDAPAAAPTIEHPPHDGGPIGDVPEPIHPCPWPPHGWYWTPIYSWNGVLSTFCGWFLYPFYPIMA